MKIRKRSHVDIAVESPLRTNRKEQRIHRTHCQKDMCFERYYPTAYIEIYNYIMRCRQPATRIVVHSPLQNETDLQKITGGRFFSFDEISETAARRYSPSCFQNWIHFRWQQKCGRHSVLPNSIFIYKSKICTVSLKGRANDLSIPEQSWFWYIPLTGNIGSHTKFGLRTAGFQDILQHLVVTVRCFDEKLCLMLTVYPLFQFLQSFLTFSRFDRQITVESETLSVEARAHDRQDNRRLPHQITTFRFLRCAIATTSAPGSATAGQPASEITPMEFPSCNGFR